jgi:predicted CoA-substrate-specific enzyme activase
MSKSHLSSDIRSSVYPTKPFVVQNPEALINRESLGICIGASTISIVRIKVSADNLIHVEFNHSVDSQGNPKATLNRLLSEFWSDCLPAVVTGRKFRKRVNLTAISESEATESALELYQNEDNRYTALASLGAENFVVYELDTEGKIRKLISKNQCASGTGEFFMQQIIRMDMDVEEAIRISGNAEPYKVSGRCSVFCKSDCTHALNKGIPKKEVTTGLALMIAEKAEELLKKCTDGRYILVGGVTRNTTVIDFLEKKFPDLFIPKEASYFEALGAAVHGLYHTVTFLENPENIFVETDSLFTFHKPLEEFRHLVTFHTEIQDSAEDGDECILGLDVGSTTTKGVIIRVSDEKILASEYLYTHGNPIKAAKQVYHSLDNQITSTVKICGLGVTGSGRHLSAIHAETRAIVNEISAHALAAVHFDPKVDTIFEIGGQDAKYTFINNKVPADYAMNEACSAGTGSFIQEAAWESLKISLEEIETAAFRARSPLNFRDQCAALIGSDIKSALQENFSRDDVLAGLTYSICINYINRVKGKRQIGEKILMQGGVCYNQAIPVAMAAITGKQIVVPPFPGLMGAYGTALKVKEEIEKGILQKGEYVLEDLKNREFSSAKSFNCQDKSNGCDRKCEINTFKINGKTMAFGGACNKYYDIVTHTEKEWQKNDFVSKRMEMIYQRTSPWNPETNCKTVGLNQTFTINRLFPLYQAFFTRLGFNIICSDEIDPLGIENQHSSFCFPVELGHGLFSNLISKQPDFIFMPEIYEMHVPGCENDQKDSSATCVFISKEANYLSQEFKKELGNIQLLHPYLNFARGYNSQSDVFVQIGRQTGIRSKRRITEAYKYAVSMQLKTEQNLLNLGNSVIEQLELFPNQIAIVLIGRDYNAFSPFANKGIPQKFASLGYKVIPYDILDSSHEEIVSYQSWEAGKRILRAARTIQKHPRLFAVYISNFSCGPDSLLVPIFRNIMGVKPSLTLELDQHTADAGINTRIDAFLDVIKNFRSLNVSPIEVRKSGFRESSIRNSGNQSVFIDSDGQQFDLHDKQVQMIVPCFGDMAAALFAASLRSLGYNAIALPEMEPEILETGLKHTSGKECLPLILLAGSLMNYVEKHRLNGERLAFLNIGGTSACRVAQYPVFLTNLVKTNEVRNVAMFTLISQEGYLGLSKGFLKRSMEAIILNDVLEDVRSGILSNAIDPEEGVKIFYKQFDNLIHIFSNDYSNLFKSLEQFSQYIANHIPYRIPVNESKYIALTGEIFIRHNQFAHKKLNHYFGNHGFILKDAYISEWVKYLDYAWRKGVDRPDFSFSETISRLIREQYITYIEAKIQKILAATGYFQPQKTSVVDLIKHSLHVLPLESTGEPALTLGTALAYGYEKYCGIINIGPFGCLQTRVGEAVSTPNMNLGCKKQVKENIKKKYKIPEHLNPSTDIPFLTIECDGKSFPQIIESNLETFLVQVNRAAENMRIARLNK